jgi:hypothetical protein
MSRRLLALLAACGDDSDDASDSGDNTDTPTAASPDDGAGDDGELAVTATTTVPRLDDGDMDDSGGDALDSAEGLFGRDDVADEADGFTNDVAQEEPADDGERIPAEATALFVGRQIIKTGEVVVEAADVRATTDDIVDVVFANGGAIWGQETRSEPTPRAILTIRVPPLDFDRLLAAITRVPGVGVVSESTTSDDVTEVVVDLTPGSPPPSRASPASSNCSTTPATSTRSSSSRRNWRRGRPISSDCSASARPSATRSPSRPSPSPCSNSTPTGSSRVWTSWHGSAPASTTRVLGSRVCRWAPRTLPCCA